MTVCGFYAGCHCRGEAGSCYIYKSDHLYSCIHLIRQNAGFFFLFPQEGGVLILDLAYKAPIEPFLQTQRNNCRRPQHCTPYWITEPGDVVGRNYVERKHRSQHLRVFTGLKLSPSLYGPTHQLAHRVSFRWFAGERPRFLPLKSGFPVWKYP